jgi:plastocyanin
MLKRVALTVVVLVCLFSCTSPEQRAHENKPTSAPVLHTVIIQQMKFMPAELTVNEGDTVTWINRDIVDHNVTEEVHKEWSSGNLPPGKSWQMVVAKSAAYLCTIHPVMKGSLNVK